MNVCLITWKVPQCLSPLWVQQVENETVILSSPSLPSSLRVPSSISRQWPDSFLDSNLQSPSVLTGPHKQGHSGCCKRKMYHLLGDRWQDVSAKSFYFDHKYDCNPAASIPLPSNWTRRQKATCHFSRKGNWFFSVMENAQTSVEKWVYLFNDLT